MPEENIQNEIPAQTTKQPGGSKKPLVIVGGLVVLAVIVGAGLFIFKDTIFPVRGISGKILNAKCKYNDPDLCRFMDNFGDVKNMKSESTATANGQTTDSTFIIQGNDKSQMISKVGGKEEANYISIGDTTYTKDYSDNKWWKSTIKKTDNTGGNNNPDWKTELDKSVNDSTDKTTYKKIGKEACGSLTCLKYQVIDPQAADTTEYLWFDTGQYLMRKEQMTSKDGTNVTEFSYDNINITAPSPTKEMPAAGTTNTLDPAAAAAAGLTPDQINQLKAAESALQNQAQAPTGQ